MKFSGWNDWSFTSAAPARRAESIIRLACSRSPLWFMPISAITSGGASPPAGSPPILIGRMEGLYHRFHGNGENCRRRPQHAVPPSALQAYNDVMKRRYPGIISVLIGVTAIMADAADYKAPSKERLRSILTAEQYHVTQENGTERPFANAYWDNKGDGIYVDIVSGEPLFSSRDKYDSGTGWPSFSRPLEKENIVERLDKGIFGARTEIRSKHGNSHLGHVFEDGPSPTGQRYCMNSAALRFIPAANMEKEGYGAYLKLFGRK
ncbi:MAG: peptide-methionine (R)-S-oxide reductase MsrB [Nitrospinae bacterium]|nr:peptide-methionine (R)-S-oxide reductase MsrB [Nitrospinota bacterium]